MLETLMTFYPFAFYGTAMCLAVAELLAPRRPRAAPVSRRWVTNIGLFVIGLAVQRVLVPGSVIVVAAAAVQAGTGVFQTLGWRSWALLPLGLLLLDLWKYAEHRLCHRLSLLWRIHMVHHSDVDVDFTTTERHHPLEILVGFAGTISVIYVFGIPPLAVAIYILLATAVAFFSHADIRVPEPVDRWLRLVIVTPAVHAVHHSAARRETDSNFGMLLSVWDRIFGSWRPPTSADEVARLIGLEYFRDPRSGRFDQVLCLPFRSLDARGQSQGANSEARSRVA